jgi:hypothetical protein
MPLTLYQKTGNVSTMESLQNVEKVKKYKSSNRTGLLVRWLASLR